MKRIIVLILFAYCILPVAYSQIKVIKATNQKSVAGMGGVYMDYKIEVKDKKNAPVKIDSVKSIADGTSMRFGADSLRPGTYQISFTTTLQPPPKCATCVETTPPPPNLTKGVTVYYQRGNKKFKCKVKKFERLEDVMMP